MQVQRSWWLLIGFFVFGLGIYWNVLNAEYLNYDDRYYIFDNPVVVNFPSIIKVFESFGPRSLVALSFIANYLYSQDQVFSYHLVNLLLHVLNAFLVYLFAFLVLEAPVPKKHLRAVTPHAVAASAALIFLSHPVQTETVAWITQRFSLVGTTCYLLTMIFYLLARHRGGLRFWMLAYLSFFLGCWSKEMIVTAPVMVTLCEYFLFGKKRLTFPGWGERIFPFFLLMLGIPWFIWVEGANSALQYSANLQSGSFRPEQLQAMILICATYLRLLVFPWPQSLFYDVFLPESLYARGFGIALAVVLGLIGTAFFLRRKAPVVSFLIAWFFVTISVETVAAAWTHWEAMFEHWLYLPMAGFSFLAAYVLSVIVRREIWFKMISWVLIVGLCFLAWQRTLVWGSNIDIWEDAARQYPQSALPQVCLGDAYAEKGQWKAAIAAYEKAMIFYSQKTKSVVQRKDWFHVLTRLIPLYDHAGDGARARNLYLQALRFYSESPEFYRELGFGYFQWGNMLKAQESFEKGIRLDLKDIRAYEYLEKIYLRLGQTEEAAQNRLRAEKLLKAQGPGEIVPR